MLLGLLACLQLLWTCIVSRVLHCLHQASCQLVMLLCGQDTAGLACVSAGEAAGAGKALAVVRKLLASKKLVQGLAPMWVTPETGDFSGDQECWCWLQARCWLQGCPSMQPSNQAVAP